MHDIVSKDLEDKESTPFKALTLDVELYQQFLDTSDHSEEQKHQLLEAMWMIMTAFADLGFDLRTEESCGQNSDECAVRNLAAEVVLSSQKTPSLRNFKAVAAASNDQRDREKI